MCDEDNPKRHKGLKDDGMLFLVGLGLSEKDMPIGSMDILMDCELYMDRFTSRISQDYVSYISERTGRRITELTRQDMEENSSEIVGRASSRDIAILVGGDPLIATTHKILYIEARRLGVPARALHASSAISAAMGESGLDFYRFGSICTIPRWSGKYKPVSFYEKIAANLERREHSMLLLDYDNGGEATIPIKDAISALEAAEAHYKKGAVTPRTKLIILHEIAQKGSLVDAVSASEAKHKDYGGMNMMVVPAELTAIEAEAVEAITGKKW